jgi:predicted aspartyl protease
MMISVCGVNLLIRVMLDVDNKPLSRIVYISLGKVKNEKLFVSSMRNCPNFALFVGCWVMLILSVVTEFMTEKLFNMRTS